MDQPNNEKFAKVLDNLVQNEDYNLEDINKLQQDLL